MKGDSHVLRHQGGPLGEALVINDYVMISREAVSTPASQALSVEKLRIAEDTHVAYQVAGSDDKTVRGEEIFKVIGAEVFSDQLARDSVA